MIFRNRYRKRMTFEKGKTLPLYFYFVKSLLFNPSPRKGKERVLCPMFLFLLSHFLSCLKNFSSFYPFFPLSSSFVFVVYSLYTLFHSLNGRQPQRRYTMESLNVTPRPRFLFIRAFGGFQLSVSRFRTSNVSLSPAVPCPDRLLGGKSHRNRAPLWGASRKSDDKLEKQTLRFSPLLCIFRNVHSVSQGASCCAQFPDGVSD